MLTVGKGFTVIEKGDGAPVQVAPELEYEGITVMVAVTGVVVVLVPVNAGISPDPLAASPTEVLLFVQVNEQPVTFAEN